MQIKILVSSYFYLVIIITGVLQVFKPVSTRDVIALHSISFETFSSGEGFCVDTDELYSSVGSQSSSLLEPGSADTEIVKRNLITDFLSATSIPVNVPLHRWRDIGGPGGEISTSPEEENEDMKIMKI